MSLIGCTNDCLYQQDGYCQLERAMSSGVVSEESPCVNYVPRSQNGHQCFSDVTNPDEL